LTFWCDVAHITDLGNNKDNQNDVNNKTSNNNSNRSE